ncbi:MBL fold metallo-hydrolase [Cryptosporangium sp. NPDC048952]|uniref:MBL fold metallo-hydrolase n=1 Tax=Cryptosporangium sp. NPDC048952 TaxID=3363961 RepID=UPI0037133C29
MPTDTLRLGADLTVTTLCDAAGTFPEPLEDAFPDAGNTGRWPMHVHCHLVRTPTRTVLVDAGIGPDWAPAGEWFGRPGRLPEELAALGVEPEEITDVILTHLHPDHIGWVVADEDDPKPYFVNARHVVQNAELKWLRESGEEYEDLYDSHIKPLVDAQLLVEVAGAATLDERLDLVLAPGHTPGHQCLLVDAPDRPLLITGDAFVHRGQMTTAGLAYRYEEATDDAAKTRRRLLSVAAERGVLLAPCHLDEGVVLVESASEDSFRTTAMARCPNSVA